VTGAASDSPPLSETLRAAREALFRLATSDGHWEGRLSSSALSTATSVAAFALAARAGVADARDAALVRRGVAWLLAHQNADGGWGDTDRSLSNISTTALVWAALALGDPRADIDAAARRAEGWLVERAGSLAPGVLAAAIVARYGKDRTFSVPILTMCALAGRLGTPAVAWRLVPHLPFEIAVVPRRFFAAMRLPVVSYALPALIAMGLAHHVQQPSRNPVTHLVRRLATGRALRVLESLQPANGGFLEAAPLTGFVAMSLVAAGRGREPVVRRALAFLRGGVREDGSWPIDTNLTTWVSTLAVQALEASGPVQDFLDEGRRTAVRGWLLGQQTRGIHPYTGAAPGGWAWTDLAGGVPDADDTPGSLLALRALGVDAETRRAAAAGVGWLLDLQNRDGGMPTFCRGWGALPFDRSGADLTAHAIRAWLAWRPDVDPVLRARIDRAVSAAVRYLRRVQRRDGAFAPLWFGNQHAPGDEENLTYGTGRVLLALQALREAGLGGEDDGLDRAVAWLRAAQNGDGGWGGVHDTPSTIEETALAVAALARCAPDEATRAAAMRGGAWLVGATARGTVFPAAPIGLYFAKLWYHEALYPVVLSVEALGRLLSLTLTADAVRREGRTP